ncbi:MAG: FAD-dependent oxidoreductase, partial [Acidobacteria bacterium]|nr:FAD-dependent oxidoreductase [Acidobacteriota bacterium]
MSRIKRIAVVGGGIGGLAAALELSKSPDVFVTLYEKESQSGGLCSSYRWKDVVCDRFYHVALSSDTETLRLGRDLGLENRLFWRGSSSGFYGSGKLVSMSSAFDFLRFPFLNPVDKLRLGLGILTAVRIRDPQSLSGLAAPVWLTQVFGR